MHSAAFEPFQRKGYRNYNCNRVWFKLAAAIILILGHCGREHTARTNGDSGTGPSVEKFPEPNCDEAPAFKGDDDSSFVIFLGGDVHYAGHLRSQYYAYSDRAEFLSEQVEVIGGDIGDTIAYEIVDVRVHETGGRRTHLWCTLADVGLISGSAQKIYTTADSDTAATAQLRHNKVKCGGNRGALARRVGEKCGICYAPESTLCAMLAGRNDACRVLAADGRVDKHYCADSLASGCGGTNGESHYADGEFSELDCLNINLIGAAKEEVGRMNAAAAYACGSCPNAYAAFVRSGTAAVHVTYQTIFFWAPVAEGDGPGVMHQG